MRYSLFAYVLRTAHSLNAKKTLTSTLYVGFFILFSGKIWIEDGSVYRTQIYIWLFLPALLLLFLKKTDLFKYRPSGSELPLILLALWVLIRSIETNTLLDQLKTVTLIVLFFWAVFLIQLNESKTVKLIVFSSLVAAAGAAATIYYQFIILGQDTDYRAHRLYEMGFGKYADLGHPVMAGIYYGFFAVISITLILKGKQPRNIKLLLIPSILTLLTYVLFTYSRGAWVSMFGSIGLVALTIQHPIKKTALVFLIVMFICFTVFYRELIISEITIQGFSGRIQIWNDIWSLIQNRPILGFGAEFEYLYGKEDLITLQKPSHAHSLYLQVWYEYGLIGLTLYTASLMLALKETILLRKSSVLAWLSGMGIIYISCNAITDIHSLLTLPGLYWTPLLFPIALANAVSRKASQKNSNA